MKWVLIITWVTVGFSKGSGIEVTTWPTLKECFAVGKAAQENFQRLYEAGNSANFSCIPSTGAEPTCGGNKLAPCK
jgi:hypothetical protein